MGRIARSTAVAVESSDPSFAVAFRDLGSLVRLDTAVVQTVRERHQVPGEPVAADMRALPGDVGEGSGEATRERASTLGTTRISSSVGTDDEQGSRRGGERRAIARIQPERILDPGDGGGAEPGVARIDRETQHGAVGVLGDAVGPADQQDACTGPPLEASELASKPVRQPGVEEPVASPGPGVLDQQPMPDRRRGACERLIRRKAPQGATVAG